MRLVHVADLHLGYRAYHRTNRHGVNVREADVARSFREALERTAGLAPEVMLIAGDVFHTVRPSNAAIADAFRQFSQFRADSPGTRVVIVAGNHDSPKSTETGSILRLFAEIDGVEVVYNQARRLALRDLDLAILCLPHSELILGDAIKMEPDPQFRHNVMLAHAALDDQRLKLLMDFGAATLSSDSIDASQWGYVALGHYHVRSRLASNMFYAGAIERTSLNIWAEADNALAVADAQFEDTWESAEWGKGFIEYDLESQVAHFHRLETPRPVIDLEPIIEPDLAPAELDAAIESALEEVPHGIADKILRLRIYNLPRDVYRELNHRRLREYRAQALHFHLVAHPPRIARQAASGAPGQRRTLEEELTEFISHRWKPELERLDRKALIELGLRYLKEAETSGLVEDRE